MSRHQDISEATIQSLTRKFLLKNEFEVLSHNARKEPLHYRIELTCPPKFKIPDHVAIKNNLVIVFEDKTCFADLFTGKCPDIEKISSFLANQHAVREFENMLGTNHEKYCIAGGFASFLAPMGSKKLIPKQFVFLSISRNLDNHFTVELAQDGGHGEAFIAQTADFELF